MLIADIGIVQNAMTVLNFEPDLVEDITNLLLSTSEDLHGTVVTDVAPGWFGGSTNAHRIAVNTTMAHQAVEEEFKKLAISLRSYSVELNKWADNVSEIDGLAGDGMMQRQSALEQVNTTLIEVSSDNMGDGHYTEPPTPAAPSTEGSTS